MRITFKRLVLARQLDSVLSMTALFLFSSTPGRSSPELAAVPRSSAPGVRPPEAVDRSGRRLLIRPGRRFVLSRPARDELPELGG